jgi:putative ABC transport system ATP-binding protein
LTTRSSAIFRVRALRKQRIAAGASFELWVPNISIDPGEIVLVKGDSGCGKSTLLDLLAMALRPDDAQCLEFCPRPNTQTDVWRLWQRGDMDALGRLRSQHMGYVLQTGGLLPFLKVRDNISLVSRLIGWQAEREQAEVVDRLGLTAHLDKLPGQLSVGERQRVAIARALAHHPSVVLADEPTASVDPMNAQVILDLLLELAARLGVTVIIASHDSRRLTAMGSTVLNHSIEKNATVTRSSFWS